MKTAIRTLVIAVLIAVGAAEVVMAQPGGGRGPGMRGGPFGNQGETVSDALVLKEERAEKVVAIFDAQRDAMRERFMSGDMPDFRNMSPDERRAAFQKMRDEAQADVIKKLSAVLSNDEIEFVKPLLGMFGARPEAQIRALRMIDISDETRGKLQTSVLIYYNTIASVQPEFVLGQPPEGGRGQGRGRGRGAMSQEDRKTIEKAREGLLTDVKATLSEEEEKAWQKKAEEIEKEMQRQRDERGQRGGGQDGQGRGQGRGGARG